MKEVKTQRIKFEERRNYQAGIISEHIGWTDFQYNEFFFETGIKFLNNHFPETESDYQHYFYDHATNKSFWAWFQMEWFIQERDALNFFDTKKVPLSTASMEREQQIFIKNETVNKSFRQFLREQLIVSRYPTQTLAGVAR
jgi:hypothetical protein